MDETAATAPSPAAAAATSASAAAGCDAARDKTMNDVVVGGVSESGSNVKLLIKSSNQQYDDVNIESNLSWTVQRLKKQLSLVYPGKPDIIDQKLIYSGKLLDDAQKLSEVIRSYPDVYQQHHIFHLVCATKHIIKPPVKLTPAKKEVPTTAQNSAELRQRHVGAHNAYQQPIQQQQPQANGGLPAWRQFWETAANNMEPNQLPTVSGNPQLMFQQQALLYNAWMQQVYAQYMHDWMQRSSGGQLPAGLPAPPLLPHMPMPMSMPVIPLASANQAPVAAPQPQQPNEVVDGGAAAAAAEAAPNFPQIQEEPEMRDWLDSFFSFTRLAIFITVLYFNSSPLRCLLVVLIASGIYLYHIGVLRRRRERNNNNINRNNNAANVAAAFAAVQQIQRMMDAVEHENNNNNNNANNGQQPEAGAAAGAAAAEPAAGQDQAQDGAAAAAPATGDEENPAALAAEAVAVVAEPPNANNSVISVVRTFVITFFTSLLPEAPAL